jgi:hypothetical protein
MNDQKPYRRLNGARGAGRETSNRRCPSVYPAIPMKLSHVDAQCAVLSSTSLGTARAVQAPVGVLRLPLDSPSHVPFVAWTGHPGSTPGPVSALMRSKSSVGWRSFAGSWDFRQCSSRDGAAPNSPSHRVIPLAPHRASAVMRVAELVIHVTGASTILRCRTTMQVLQRRRAAMSTR